MSPSNLFEQRRIPRHKPMTDISATLLVDGSTHPSAVLDYSPTGMRIRVHREIAKRYANNTDIELLVRDVVLPGQIRHHRVEADEKGILGIQIPLEGSDDEISFRSQDPGWDLVPSAEDLNKIFTDLIFRGPQSPIEVRQSSARLFLVAKEIKEEILVAEILSTSYDSLQASRASFRFDLFQTCHWFESRVRQVSEKSVHIELPQGLARLLRRETFRVQNPTEGPNFQIHLTCAVLGIENHKFLANDIGEHGLSLIDLTGILCGPRGIGIEKISIRIPQQIKVSGHGKIASARWNPKEERFFVGIQFETETDVDRTRWHNAILKARYPKLSFSYVEKDHPKIWDLFEKSGYLDLKPREAFTHVVDVTKKTWKQLSEAGTKSSKRVMLRDNDDIAGHLQMDRIYPETWCVHHLAIDQSASKIVAKDIYTVLTDVLSAEGASFVISLTQASKPWNQRNYYDFVKNYPYPNHHELRTYQIYEVETDKGWDLAKKSQMKVRVANRYDKRRIVRYFEVYGSALEREACGLTDKDLDLANFDEEVRDFGLSRKREFLVGTINNELVGFARVESGSSGVNIFGLLDMLYVHMLPAYQDDHASYEALVDAGLNHFRSLGKKDIIVALDDGRSDYYSKRGLTYIWDGIRWIAQNVATRRYYAFSQMLYGHLLLKREKIRRKRSRA